MLIAAVLCLCAAAVTAAFGLWSLAHRHPDDPVRRVLRAVAPTQLAAAVMLAAGATEVLVTHRHGAVILTVCVAGAVGTVAAGCYQAAKSVARVEAAPTGCAGSCASCVLPCK